MDTVYVGNIWRGLVNQYKQMRRWAWEGAFSHMMGTLTRIEIPRRKALTISESNGRSLLWATAPILIFIMGYLPLWLAGEVVNFGARLKRPH